MKEAVKPQFQFRQRCYRRPGLRRRLADSYPRVGYRN